MVSSWMILLNYLQLQFFLPLGHFFLLLHLYPSKTSLAFILLSFLVDVGIS
jgi:hypothetical protein